MAVVLLVRSSGQRRQLDQQQIEVSRRYYEALMLYEVSSRIGYSFSISSIAEAMALSVETLFPLSTISYAAVQDSKIVIKTFQKETVSEKYLKQIEEITLNSMHEVDSSTLTYPVILEVENGQANKNYMNLHYETSPQSYFMIPLVVRDTFVGVITVTSRLHHAFSNEDMTVLYKVIQQAEKTAEQMQEIVSAEQRKLSALISGIPSGALLFSLTNGALDLVSINHAAKNFLGFTEQDTVNAVIILHSFGIDLQMENKIIEAISQKKSTIMPNITLGDRIFNLIINPIDVKEPNVLNGATVSMEDISMQHELQQVRESFTNMVVHELRAPVTAIKGASSLLLDSKVTNKDYDKMLHIIKGSAERMLNQVNDLLDVAKLEAGKFSIVESEADLNPLIDERLESFKFQADDKKITLQKLIDESIPQFAFDKFRIDQVITNLMSNALKFTPEGGMITISSRKNGDRIEVSVKDTGIGIPKDKQSMLFTQFGQIQNMFRRDGTGLGLYISR